MSNVITFASKKTKKASAPAPIINTFTEALEDDITRLCATFEGDVDRNRAIEIASDFYRKYPMLVEYVRSPEYMLRKE